jgi:hypothetical protein
MEESQWEITLRLKANKRRVQRLYKLYTDTLATNQGIQSQLWFADSYSHLKRIYEAHKESSWLPLDLSSTIFVDDAEYRLALWERHQVSNN